MAIRSLSSELQVILLCARMELTATQEDEVRALTTTDFDWARLLSLATVHGVRPLLFRNLKAHCDDLLPAEVAEKLRRFRHLNVAKALLLTREQRTITALLAAEDIPVIPYKGIVLGEQIYGDAALRESGDIDIIVHPEEVAIARQILEAVGYRMDYEFSPTQEAVYLRSNCEYAFTNPENHLDLELHWDVAPSVWPLRLDWDGIWRRTQDFQISDGLVKGVLSPEDQLLLLCIHGSKHLWTMLKWLADVAQFIVRFPALDWSVLMDRSSDWGTKRMTLLGCYMASTHFETPLPDPIWRSIEGDKAVVSLADKLSATLEDPGSPNIDVSRAAHTLTLHDRWQDRTIHGWRLLTGLTHVDIDQEDRSMAAYRLNRPMRIIRERGWRPMAKVLAQMSAEIGAKQK